MKIQFPELSLVVLIGASGSGKSSFARKHFAATEIVSSDACRAMVSDDENDQNATNDAFDLLQYLVGKRLARGKLTVIDATNVQMEARRPLVQLAREHDVLPVAVVLNPPPKVCHERNQARADRRFGEHVVRNQAGQLRRSLRGLSREGFRQVEVLETVEQIEAVKIERAKLWTDRRDERGPFDVIGDVHGCYAELVELLGALGWTIRPSPRPSPGVPGEGEMQITPPPGRKAIFVGDLVDRGPDSPAVLKLVMRMVEAGHALCVPGNHDVKLMKKLRGRDVQIAHGLAETLAQLANEPPEFAGKVADFIDRMVSHYVLDGGRLVVSHAGIKQQYIGRASSRIRDFCLYGETTGEMDEQGLPERINWALDYRGAASVVYGHTPVREAEWLNRTINIDTGCVFGGKLTALRWPEREVISVAAKRVYAESKRFELTGTARQSAQQAADDVLDIDDVLGKRVIQTGLIAHVTIREENASAALEVMSRFAADPRWLIYMPPTMSPCETSERAGLLEHPAEAFSYFTGNGVARVMCEEKHMGSRAVVIVCRDESAARRRFGASDEGIGIVYTRTGRRFFDDGAMERGLLAHLHESVSRAGFWERFNSDWFCLDCELMPWSAKAQQLLKTQYAAVGSAGRAAIEAAVEILPPGELREKFERRREQVARYTQAYRRYCWPVRGVEDLRLAPFHLLASEGAVYVEKDHLWHMTTLAELAREGSSIMATRHLAVDLNDPVALEGATRWWEGLTAAGGEGMVVKPMGFVARGQRGLVQPAVKCRGREYLRIIYGPEYDAPENLERLRQRGLSAKRSLALREFALGVEGLNRLVRKEPLRAVHECVFGVLALESEPVDPRL